jgi:hypothetical protein
MVCKNGCLLWCIGNHLEPSELASNHFSSNILKLKFWLALLYCLTASEAKPISNQLWRTMFPPTIREMTQLLNHKLQTPQKRKTAMNETSIGHSTSFLLSLTYTPITELGSRQHARCLRLSSPSLQNCRRPRFSQPGSLERIRLVIPSTFTCPATTNLRETKLA